MNCVCDASVVVAAVADAGPAGVWARELLWANDLHAPHSMPIEAVNVLRRAVLAGELSEDSATLAVIDLTDLKVALYPFEPFATRVWELRRNVTANDAWYVALAEAIGAGLATLDTRLARADEPKCSFMTPG